MFVIFEQGGLFASKVFYSSRIRKYDSSHEKRRLGRVLLIDLLSKNVKLVWKTKLFSLDADEIDGNHGDDDDTSIVEVHTLEIDEVRDNDNHVTVASAGPNFSKLKFVEVLAYPTCVAL